MKPKRRLTIWSILGLLLLIACGFLFAWLERRLGIESDDSNYDSRPLDWRRFE